MDQLGPAVCYHGSCLYLPLEPSEKLISIPSWVLYKQESKIDSQAGYSCGASILYQGHLRRKDLIRAAREQGDATGGRKSQTIEELTSEEHLVRSLGPAPLIASLRLQDAAGGRPKGSVVQTPGRLMREIAGKGVKARRCIPLISSVARGGFSHCKLGCCSCVYTTWVRRVLPLEDLCCAVQLAGVRPLSLQQLGFACCACVRVSNLHDRAKLLVRPTSGTLQVFLPQQEQARSGNQGFEQGP